MYFTDDIMATLAKCTRMILSYTKASLHLKCLLTKSAPALSQLAVRNVHMSRPVLADKKFSDKHEWIVMEGDIGTVGISDYAQDQLGDVVYAQLPEEGTELDQDEECGALESVKAASEIYTPVSGTITESNSEVVEKPALINQSCYDDGWLFKIKLSNPEELSDLMDEDGYERFLKQQEELQ